PTPAPCACPPRPRAAGDLLRANAGPACAALLPRYRTALLPGQALHRRATAGGPPAVLGPVDRMRRVAARPGHAGAASSCDAAVPRLPLRARLQAQPHAGAAARGDRHLSACAPARLEPLGVARGRDGIRRLPIRRQRDRLESALL